MKCKGMTAEQFNSTVKKNAVAHLGRYPGGVTEPVYIDSEAWTLESGQVLVVVRSLQVVAVDQLEVNE